MMLNSHNTLPSARNLRGHALAGPGGDEGWQALRTKYGDSGTVDVAENLAIMTEVGKYVDPKGWQYCTINALLDGLPSEDDLSWKARYFSEMPRLEEVCGDHALSDQYAAALSDMVSGGAAKEFAAWLQTKSAAKRSKKAAVAEKEGQTGFGKGVKALNPLEDPRIVFGIAAAIALILVWKFKK